ncbi:MAG: hypothetical protein KAI66_22905 [Lentisphaeria bacterium]|nr:hypothetical protein [Lentisphaeria bacterium]
MVIGTIKRVFVVHHTHMDVGYTDLPHEVMDQHLGHLDLALDLCRENPDLPPERRFHWTCESALLVQDYLACRPRMRRDELLTALREGWIELMAFLTQPLTELCDAQTLVDCLRYAMDLGRHEGFEVSCGMIDDIGGYAGRLPTVMSEMGVPYLVAGVGAFQVHLPWADLPHLFYLQDKGGARILVWNLGIDRLRTPQEMTNLAAVYGQGALYLIMPFAKAFGDRGARGVELDVAADSVSIDARTRFGELEERLAAERYPYAEVLLQYGGDNRGPDPQLSTILQGINDCADMPPVQLCTPSVFFREMVRLHGDSIPVVEGVMTDPWNLRVNPQPVGVSMHRRAGALLNAAEARLALRGERATSEETTLVVDARRNLQLTADHTCGLSEWSWPREFEEAGDRRAPAFDRYRRSWSAKRFYGESALRAAERLDRMARHKISTGLAGKARRLVVWNDTPYLASGPATLYTGRGGPDLQSVRDSSGNEIPMQRVASKRYVLWVENVPGYGCVVLVPVLGKTADSPADSAPFGGPFLRLQIAAESGRIRSVRDAKSDVEYLDDDTSLGLGETVYERLEGVPTDNAQAGMKQNFPRLVQPVRTESVEVSATGPVFDELTVCEQVDGAAGSVRVVRTVRVYRTARRIDVDVRLDKPENEAKEAVQIAFPFAGDGEVAFDQNIGWVDPSAELIPGSLQDAMHCASWALSRSGVGTAILACPDAPIVEFGRPRLGEWSDEFPFVAGNGHIFGFIYQNLLNTDCPIWQELLHTFRYVCVFEPDAVGAAFAERVGTQALTPLRADLLEHSAMEVGAMPPQLEIGHPDVRVLSLARRNDGSLDLLLENAGARAVRTSLCTVPAISAAHRCGLSGDVGKPLPARAGVIVVELQPFELVRLSLTRMQ